MKVYTLDIENMTLEEKIQELKYNKRFMKVCKFMEFFSIGSTIYIEAQFVKDVYIKSYMAHVDYLRNPSCYMYLVFTGFGIFSYIECSFMYEMLNNENIEIQKNIDDGIKIKKLTY